MKYFARFLPILTLLALTLLMYGCVTTGQL